MATTAYGIEPDIVNFDAVRLSFYRGLPSLSAFLYRGNLFACLRRRQINNSPNNVAFICVYKSVDGGKNWAAYPGLTISTPAAGQGGINTQDVTTQIEGNTVYFLVTSSPPNGIGPMQMVTFNLDTLSYSVVSGGGPQSQNGNTTAGMFVLNGIARIVYGRNAPAFQWGWYYTTWSAGGGWGAEEVAVAAAATNQNSGQFAFNPANGDVGFWCRLNNVNNITVRHAGAWTAPVPFAVASPNPALTVSSQPGFYSVETDSWVFPSSRFNAGPSAYDGVIVTATPSANPAAPVAEAATVLTAANFSIQYPVAQEQGGTFFYSWVLYDNNNAAQQMFQVTRPAAGGVWSSPTTLWDAGAGIYINPASVANAVLGVANIDVNMIGPPSTALAMFENPPSGGVGGSLTMYYIPVPLPPTTVFVTPAPSAGKPTINRYNICLLCEYRMFENLKFMSGCRKPACFNIDEREWGMNTGMTVQ